MPPGSRTSCSNIPPLSRSRSWPSHARCLASALTPFALLRNVVEEAELQRHSGDLLSDYKVPEMFHRLEGTLPRNANGKVLKRSLREILVA